MYHEKDWKDFNLLDCKITYLDWITKTLVLTYVASRSPGELPKKVIAKSEINRRKNENFSEE